MVLVANCDDLEPIMVKVASYDLEVYICIYWTAQSYTRLAQSVERTPFKRVVVGSSPTSGVGRDYPLVQNQKSRGNGETEP